MEKQEVAIHFCKQCKHQSMNKEINDRISYLDSRICMWMFDLDKTLKYTKKIFSHVSSSVPNCFISCDIRRAYGVCWVAKEKYITGIFVCYSQRISQLCPYDMISPLFENQQFVPHFFLFIAQQTMVAIYFFTDCGWLTRTRALFICLEDRAWDHNLSTYFWNTHFLFISAQVSPVRGQIMSLQHIQTIRVHDIALYAQIQVIHACTTRISAIHDFFPPKHLLVKFAIYMYIPRRIVLDLCS